jgi:hypothetical protein
MQADPDWDDLVAAMWQELGTLPPDIDWERMQTAARAGYFACWAGKVDGEIAAWIEFNLGPHYHYGKTKFAWDCGHWCRLEHRPWLWIKLWRSALLALQALGVDIVIAHSNPRQNLERVFTGRLGFEPAGQMYQREL